MANQFDNSANDSCWPATAQEKEKWNGFFSLLVLTLSKALFNVMLREFGVKGVKVQEVVSLDEEMMAFLNKPVYGLIFLFRWREDDPEKQEASCPEGLWFANQVVPIQTTSNACASVALLNIVNNIEGLELGDNLQHFKDFTMPFTPALRGDAISNFDFVKRIHNSFARKMDMLNSDLQLKNEATSRRSRSRFHFIAFVPALGKVWKFDGLERQPQALGPCTPNEDWLGLVKPHLITRMTEYEEDQIEFSILSLVRDPLVDLIGKLAVNIKCLELLNQRLTTQAPAVAHSELPFASRILENTILGPDKSFDMTRESIDQAIVPVVLERYNLFSAQENVGFQQKLCNEQQALRAAIRDEQQTQRADDDYAAGRRYDYGPAIRTWVRFLARKGVIESLMTVGEKKTKFVTK
ncbi:ubiquitin carboxyl-terminal hydrolase [Aspergillus minisclerotigenes]|uniref:Ubiquitin carboxyl-terminal hydrolase n=1 Tax=Aspergillus minisclerotigenes TaxID=656917 RepID=A0A5N6ITJ6_9EURO|nr:ubiquitin carboxyl-terminal hydrolase [Aspergillus minisclerotigenes]